jgi:hypothetical protein
MTSITDSTKKQGRRATTGKGIGVLVRFQHDDLELLESWVAANGEMSRATDRALGSPHGAK